MEEAKSSFGEEGVMGPVSFQPIVKEEEAKDTFKPLGEDKEKTL